MGNDVRNKQLDILVWCGDAQTNNLSNNAFVCYTPSSLLSHSMILPSYVCPCVSRLGEGRHIRLVDGGPFNLAGVTMARCDKGRLATGQPSPQQQPQCCKSRCTQHQSYLPVFSLASICRHGLPTKPPPTFQCRCALVLVMLP